MSGHEQFAEDLALYAIGALEAKSCPTLEKHLSECPACRNELAEMRGNAALLAMSVTGPAAPQRSRERLLGAIAHEPHPVRVRMRRPWWSFAPVAVAALLAAFCVLLLQDNLELRHRVDELKAQNGQSDAEIQKAKMVLDAMMSQDAVHIAMAADVQPPQPYGHCIYSAQHGAIVFTAANLPALPANKTYQLWLMPTNGHAAMPAGTFKADWRGNATVMEEMASKNIESRRFGVTVEADGGSPWPTGPLVLQGNSR